MPRKKKASSENEYKAFPKILKQLMDNKGVKQPQVAEYLGISPQAVSNYCTGKSSPDWEGIVKLAQLFDVSSDYLLGLSRMRAEKDGNQYLLTISEKQLRVICAALEEYFRLPLNQWWDLADRLSMKGVDLDSKNPNHSKIFDAYISTRDAVREVFAAAGRIMWPNGSPHKDEEQLICEDIWQVIRHQLWLDREDKKTWTVDSAPPMQFSKEALPIIERVGD